MAASFGESRLRRGLVVILVFSLVMITRIRIAVIVMGNSTANYFSFVLTELPVFSSFYGAFSVINTMFL